MDRRRPDRPAEPPKSQLNPPFCKIISGLGGRDLQRIHRLSALYRLAGADWLDVAADPAVVKAAVQGRAWAEQQPSCPSQPMKIMVSVGLAGDPHVGAALIDAAVCATCSGCVLGELKACVDRPLPTRAPECPSCQRCAPACPLGAIRMATALVDGESLQSCMDAGAQAIELHVAGAQPGALTQGLAQVGRVLTGDHWLSVSVGAHRQTPSEIADVFYEVRALSRPHCLLQVEGTPMSGGLGGGDDRSLELVKEVMHLAPDAAVQIAGGTDLGTAQRCHAAQLLVVGIAFGTFARLQVAAALDVAGEGMRIDPEILQQSIENARQLVHSVRSPEQWSF